MCGCDADPSYGDMGVRIIVKSFYLNEEYKKNVSSSLLEVMLRELRQHGAFFFRAR